MPFTGKATYTAGASLPELAEDVADIIGLVSPFETPLLDHLGDAANPATSTVHEWLEDSLLPNTDAVNDSTYANPATDTNFVVDHGDRFQIGDQIQLDGKAEVMLVTAIAANTLTVVRQYGGSPASNLADNEIVKIIGHAALEGEAATAARFTNRVRKQNYTQIFTATVEVSGSQLASKQIGLADELDYQKQERLRELVRSLENSVINGFAASVNPQGDASTRRSMRGILATIQANRFSPGSGIVPLGEGDEENLLTEAMLNGALRAVWENSSAKIDTIVCGGFQKRRINQFVASTQRFREKDTAFKQMIDVYESDFGICRVIMSRWLPSNGILLLDSSRLSVVPLGGRSFHFKKLASTGDSEIGQVIGEYTLEMRNENAHAYLTDLGVG
jgi:hypothetical protein